MCGQGHSQEPAASPAVAASATSPPAPSPVPAPPAIAQLVHTTTMSSTTMTPHISTTPPPAALTPIPTPAVPPKAPAANTRNTGNNASANDRAHASSNANHSCNTNAAPNTAPFPRSPPPKALGAVLVCGRGVSWGSALCCVAPCACACSHLAALQLRFVRGCWRGVSGVLPPPRAAWPRLPSDGAGRRADGCRRGGGASQVLPERHEKPPGVPPLPADHDEGPVRGHRLPELQGSLGHAGLRGPGRCGTPMDTRGPGRPEHRVSPSKLLWYSRTWCLMKREELCGGVPGLDGMQCMHGNMTHNTTHHAWQHYPSVDKQVGGGGTNGC